MTTSTARSVLITGGSRGIGAAIATRFAVAGHKVAVASTSGAAPEGILGIPCDVSDAASVDAAFAAAAEANGPVEIAVANAGITADGLVMRMSDEQFDRVLDVNLKGAFHVARTATKQMTRARFGRVIFIGSVVGLYGNAGQVNYAASKAALVGMARSLAREVGKRGVTFNVVAPGFITTDMTAELPETVIADLQARTPAGRLGDPDEVAAAVEFLAGDAAGYINGAVLPVDGGLGMGH